MTNSFNTIIRGKTIDISNKVLNRHFTKDDICTAQIYCISNFIIELNIESTPIWMAKIKKIDHTNGNVVKQVKPILYWC
jgi:hypothetical protein